MESGKDTEQLAVLAAEGDTKAMEALICRVRDPIFSLAVKMLYSPSDAEDAAQEIFIKIITRLDGFRGESSFHTWAMRIASNHILTRRKLIRKRAFTFKSCEEMIIHDQPDPAAPVEQAMVVDEMRIICVQGLFQCLDRKHRIAYILARTMDVTGPEGAAILGISPANFRKRVSRARLGIRRFLEENCELFHRDNPCKCRVQASAAVNGGLIDPARPKHLNLARTRGRAARQLEKMGEMAREVALMRIHPDYAAPEALTRGIQELMNTRQAVLEEDG